MCDILQHAQQQVFHAEQTPQVEHDGGVFDNSMLLVDRCGQLRQLHHHLAWFAPSADHPDCFSGKPTHS